MLHRESLTQARLQAETPNSKALTLTRGLLRGAFRGSRAKRRAAGMVPRTSKESPGLSLNRYTCLTVIGSNCSHTELGLARVRVAPAERLDASDLAEQRARRGRQA